MPAAPSFESAAVESADVVWACASLCGLHRMPFDARLFLQQFPPPVTLPVLARALQELGLELQPLPAGRLDVASTPLLVLRPANDVLRLSVVLSIQGEEALVSEREGAPRAMPLAELAGGNSARVFRIVPGRAPSREEGEHPAPKFGLRWFLPELWRHRSAWRDVLAASLLMQAIALAVPLCTQLVIDKVVVHQAQSTLLVIVSALALLLLFNAALGYVRQVLLLHAGNRIDAALGARVFEHLLRLPPRYFENRPTGTVVARLQGVDAIREFLTGAAASVVLDLPFVLVFAAIMFWYSPLLTAIALSLIALLALVSLALTPLLRRRLQAQFLAGARTQAFLTEYVSAMDTVKALQLEPQLAQRYGHNLGAFLQESFRARHLANGYQVLASALEQALAVAVLAAGAWLVMANDGFTIGMLVAFQMFSARLAQPALRLAGLWQEFQQASIAVERLGDLMDAPAEPVLVRSSRLREGLARVEAAEVHFAYSSSQAPIFEGLSLGIEPGQCVALVGPSGSGKSTLARLLIGFHFPTSGAIRIDGQDTRQLGANELRAQFGVVPQETRLFSGTLHDNLSIAQPHASFQEIVEACRLAEIHDFIETLPQGYYTPVGEHGAGLSGGQKQRIAIARALLRRPRILVFDEATASLDRDTAAAIGATVRRLAGRVTVVFIAHHVPESLVPDVTLRLEAPRARGLQGIARDERRVLSHARAAS